MDTRSWQNLLRTLGFPIVADGVYGPMTTRATGDFQGMCTWVDRVTGQQLVVDGIKGPRTIEMALRVEALGGQISPNFWIEEVRCHCAFPWPDGDRVVFDWLERGRADSPRRLGYQPGVFLLSGHRVTSRDFPGEHDHNAAVGGSPNGHHTCHPRGLRVHAWCSVSAVDIGNWRTLQWSEEYLRDHMGVTGGIGLDGATGWGIHIDNRKGDNGHPIEDRWFYRKTDRQTAVVI